MAKIKSRGKDIWVESTQKMGADREVLKLMVYKKGRKLPPKSFHHPPVVGIAGYKRAFISVQRGGPNPRPLPARRVPTFIPLRDTSTVVTDIVTVGVRPPKFGRNRRVV